MGHVGQFGLAVKGIHISRSWESRIAVGASGENGTPKTAAFAPLVFDQWEVLERRSRRHAVAARQVLQLQDELPSSVIVLRTGVVKLVRLQPNGAESILGLRSSGWMMLPASTILNRPAPLSVVTLTPCSIQTISRSDFLQELDANPELMRDLTVLMSLEMEAEQAQQIEFRSGTAESRLKRLMEEIRSTSEEPGGMKDLPLKKFEIAQLLSITPEHLSRLLHANSAHTKMKVRAAGAQ